MAIVIILSTKMDKLALVLDQESGNYLKYPLDVQFDEIFRFIELALKDFKYSRIIMQDPENLPELLHEFCRYTNSPVPPGPAISKKVALSEKLLRYIENRVLADFPGVDFVIKRLSLDHYITDPDTGELIPPGSLI